MSDTGFRLHKEKNFENAIASDLAASGWRRSENDEGYDRARALYPADVIEWLKTAYPKEFAQLQKLSSWETMLLDRLQEVARQHGALALLRDPIGIVGVGRFKMSESAPEDERNAEVARRYKSNILRVVQQVHYNTTSEESLDLVFFINGIPVATVEVKTDFTQGINDAVDEYRTRRNPLISRALSKVPLIVPVRGAIVHFALTESDIQMTTRLNGNETRFLPFNQGNNGHAGNPPASDAHPYPTDFFWKEVCQPDSWLRIFHSFVFAEKKGTALIFPRYHQWRAVSRLVFASKVEGPGHSYLIEHSAGSGKTKTITWTAFQLSNLRHSDGDPFFDTILIVSDRTVLNDQLSRAVMGFKAKDGVAIAIGEKGGSKSKELAKQLEEGRRIVVVTIQTFPFAMEQIVLNEKLRDKHFAVIFDEAHNSQTGATSGKLQTALGLSGQGESLGETLDDYLLTIQKSRKRPKNVSYYGFTATPKHATLMLFGRSDLPPRDGAPLPVDENGQVLPQSFDIYPMRQAIEEHFILDVLQGYVAYKTAYQLAVEVEEKSRVDKHAATRALAKWKALHPTNVSQKTAFIIEHFLKNVAPLLGGQAKAMIVASSRAAVVRYKMAFDRFLESYPELRDKAFLKIGVPIAAFSGDVPWSECIHENDKPGEEFAEIDPQTLYNEKNLNPGIREALDVAFNTDAYRLMIVANKFQTGFDQPKLCAMYIDKPIGNDVEIVQTYSRLNRIYPNKDRVYIVDFVNQPANVLRAFHKYDSGAKIEDIQDPNVVYEMRAEIEGSLLFDQDDLEKFKDLRYGEIYTLTNATEATHADLYALFDRPAKSFNERLRIAHDNYVRWELYHEQALMRGSEADQKDADAHIKEAADEIRHLQTLKKQISRFNAVYCYISQLVSLGDADLEVFASYCQFLAKRLEAVPRENVDISGILLTGYSILTNGGAAPEDEAADVPLKPISNGKGSQEGELPVFLHEVVEKLNSLFGDLVPQETQLNFVNGLANEIRKDPEVMLQVQHNTPDAAKIGRLAAIMPQRILGLLGDYQKLVTYLVQNRDTRDPLVDLVYDLLTHDEITASELREASR